MTRTRPDRLTIELVALPDAVPADVRFRRLLKQALRTFRLRCTRLAVDFPRRDTAPPPADPRAAP
jgi:hypothetical protein